MSETAETQTEAAPQRRHTKPKQAPADAEWWGVLAMKKNGMTCAPGSRPIFRHPTPDTALSEAEYLSASNRGQRFVVLHCHAAFVNGQGAYLGNE
jgi:hypothetical protein